MINWKPIKTAPYNKTVLLYGDSGMCEPNNKNIILGYRRRDYHNMEWNNIHGDCYSDMLTSPPTHWAEIPNFPE